MIVPIRNGKLESDLDLNGFNLLNASGVMGFLPSQVGQGGKYLTTNGTIANWGTIDLSAYQLLSSTLTLLAGVDASPNTLIYFDGSSNAALSFFTTAGRDLVDDANATAQRVTLGLVIGTNVQAFSSALTSWAAITRASGFDTFVATPSSANLKALLTDETGSGAAVFANTPTLVTPDIGAATGTSLTLVNPGEGIFDSGGQLHIRPAASSNIVYVGNNTASTIQLHVIPGIAGGDGVLKIGTLIGATPYHYRMVASQSTTNWQFLDNSQVVRLSLLPIGGPVFESTTSSTPIIVRQSGGTAGVHETNLYQTGGDLNVTPATASGWLTFLNTKYSGGGLQGRTNDGAAFAGTGMWRLYPASPTGYTELESDNDTGFRLNSNSHDQGTPYARIQMDSAGTTITNHRRIVTAKTANYTIVASDSGSTFTNTGAGGAVNLTLPTAVAGMQYTFYIDAAQTLTITAGASTSIRIAASASASAGNITSNTTGNCITLFAISTTKWVAQSNEGTWTVN